MAGPWEKYRSGGQVVAPNPLKVQGAVADIEGKQAGTQGQILQNQRIPVQTQGDALSNEEARRKLTQNPISEKDQDFINKLRESAASIPQTIGTINSSAGAIDRFNPSQGKGALYGMFQAEDNDWPTTSAAKGIGRLFLDDQGVKDYEDLRSLQEKQVLNTQVEQKGPQTESDAARTKLSQIAPNKSKETNARLVGEAMYNAKMGAYKPSFYTQWANRFGSINAVNKSGKTADEVWTQVYNKNYPVGGKAKKPPENDGWKIERLD